MELIIVVVLVLVAVWYGMFRPVETAAKALADEVEVLAAERKADHVKKLNGIDLTKEEVSGAKDKLKMLQSIDL